MNYYKCTNYNIDEVNYIFKYFNYILYSYFIKSKDKLLIY